MKQYYVLDKEGKRYGPRDLDGLKAWAAQGRVKPETKLVDADTEEEINASSLDIFGSAAKATTTKAVSSGPAAPTWNPPSQATVMKLVSPKAVLDWLETGNLFSLIVAVIMKISAALLSLGILVSLFKLGDFFRYAEGAAVLVLLISLIIILWTVVLIIQLLWIRSEQIRTAPPCDTPILRLTATVIRVHGEASAIFAFGMGVAIAMGIAMGGGSPALGGVFGLPLPGLDSIGHLVSSSRGGLLEGLALLALMSVYAVVYLGLSYFLAELIEVVVRLLGHLKAIRENTSRA